MSDLCRLSRGHADISLGAVFSNTQSGAAVANDTMIHLGVPGLPMGGIGPSGCMSRVRYFPL